MSYSCEISFKQIEADKVYDFLVNFKNELKNHFKEIANKEFIFSPVCRDKNISFKDKADFEKISTWENKDKLADWAKEYIFKYRYFYIPNRKLLGVFSVDTCMQYLFDDTIYFQNSCDQDYDYETWDKIDEFKRIKDTILEMPADYIISQYTDGDDEWFEEIKEGSVSIDYVRKSVCYQTIWEDFEKYLYDEENIVYFSAFGNYEDLTLFEFCRYCFEEIAKHYKNIIK